MDEERFRAWVYTRQGLAGTTGAVGAREALVQYGWQRSVGGVNPYLALFARSGEGRARVDALAAAKELYELPSARGCTYVLPAEHFALGLALAQGMGAASEVRTARQLGVPNEEIENLQAQVVIALEKGGASPAELKSALGDHVRNLGEAGKKKGLTTTLPLALALLQLDGKIRRVPGNGRFDTQRYAYERWEPVLSARPDPDTAATEVAWLYFGWTGAASLADFREFTGFTAQRAKAACASAGIVAFDAESGLLALPGAAEQFQAFERPMEPAYSVVGNLDSFLLLRRGTAFWLSSADRAQKVLGEKGVRAAGELRELSSHAILDRGRLIGEWEFDPEVQRIVWHAWVPQDDALLATLAATEVQIREELEDARSFSLDSPASRRPRITALEALAVETTA